MLRITHNNFVSKPGFNAEVTRRLQTVNRNAAPDTLSHNVKATKQHKSTNSFAKTFVPFVLVRGQENFPPLGSRRESAQFENQLTGGGNGRMCVNAHIRNEVHIRDILKFGQNSIQVCIRFGFNDRITVTGFRFQSPAIKKSDHSSTVTNKFGRL